MNLISKYNIPVPRYTSYPTVPFWDNNLAQESWKTLVKESFIKYNDTEGISIYIHLPFCESLCTYCACNTRITVNHAVESPYIKTLLKEWQLYLNLFDTKPNIKEIHLGGGTPTFFSAPNLHTLINTILSQAIITPHTDMSFEAHPSNTTTEHLTTLYNLGFKRVSFGIQDFDIKVQEAINRYQTFDEVKYIVNKAREIGYESINFDLVYGLPFQTVQSTLDTIQKSISLKPDRIAFYSYAHVPWLKKGQRKFTEMDLPVDAIKRELYEKGKDLFIENGYYDIGMDHFSLPHDSLYTSTINQSLHRNFMGYTPKHTNLSIGLGTSSISDCWTAFSQNIKTVEEYQAQIEKGEFAITKGHVLTSNDLILRKHILNIMCKGFTSWGNANEYCYAIEEALERLKELENDRLVELSSKTLKVTEHGKAFLRNICMCFDARYWISKPTSQVFSAAV